MTRGRASNENVLKRKKIWPLCAGIFLAGLFPAALGCVTPPQQTHELRGEVLDEKGGPIEGAICTLAGGVFEREGVSVNTSPTGQFSIRGLLPGAYQLTCTALGYFPTVRSGLEITQDGAPFVQVLMPPEKRARESVEVRGEATRVSQQESAPAAHLTAPELTALPIARQKFKAALPLVPGVVRTPDGKITIKGSAENQGMLLLNSAEAVAPVSGGYDIDLSIDAIQSLDVYKSPFDAQYGGFSGGLTSIQTKPPSSQRGWDFNDFFPGFRGRSGSLVGVADWEPRLSFTGPLIANKLNFSEAFFYELNKQPVRGLAWPHNETKKEGFNSFTEFQYIFSPQHLLSVTVHIFPIRHQFADINSLLPQSASSDSGQRGFALAGTDRRLLSAGAISTALFKFTKLDSYAHGQGSDPMLLTPGVTGGNYFNAWTRTSRQEEASESFEFPGINGLGKHALKTGINFIHRSFDGISRSRTVRLLRANGSLAEQIDFASAMPNRGNLAESPLGAANTQVALFIQDHWALNDQAGVELGLRYTGQSLGDAANLAPRLGLVFSPDKSGKTIFRGGVGIFHGTVPLLAGDFAGNPTRIVSLFDAQETPAGPPLTFRNACAKAGSGGLRIIPSCSDLDSTPHNTTWKVEVDHQIQSRLAVRFSFLSSRTFKDFVINPQSVPDLGPALLLSNRGSSRYHEFESTLTYHSPNRSELNISYVHSRARGNLNSVSQIFVPFEQPVIRPDLFANLPSDIPNRLIAWGIFKLPSRITFAPIVDLHTGFPYSSVDVLQDYAGVPNTRRLPAFFSFDFKIAREFHLPQFAPFGLRKKKFRMGLALRNVTDHANPRDVFNNIASPFFGNLLGFQHRVYEVNFDTGD